MKLTFLQFVLPDSTYTAVPVMNLYDKLYSPAPRKKWHVQLVRPAHGSVFHLPGERSLVIKSF